MVKKSVRIEKGELNIVVSLTGNNTDSLMEQAKKAAASEADIIEWRADYFTERDTVSEFSQCLTSLREAIGDKLLLFTFRTKEEGGLSDISIREYHELCLAVAESGKIDLIDVELSRIDFLGREFIKELKDAGVKVILSFHDFEQTPDDPTLIYRIGMMNQFGADIGKIAVMPNNLQDVLRLMGIITKARAFNQLPLAVIGMGELGKVTRISGKVTGSILTFAALDTPSAPGQFAVDQIKSLIDALTISE
ncbi:MAG TPA: type I 3-dehydroquinate dehydratase [Candidatus Tetragenococcus pullicola]|nr:type I 3-dehydroquinate dehydratase [Candidatus Tetragenococcus pullicola]